MTNRKSNNRPTHRVSFARIVGQDQDGKDQLWTAKEIGASGRGPKATAASCASIIFRSR